MKQLGVTATLYIGKQKVAQTDWSAAIKTAGQCLAFRRLNRIESAVAYVAVAVHYLATGKEIK